MERVPLIKTTITEILARAKELIEIGEKVENDDSEAKHEIIHTLMFSYSGYEYLNKLLSNIGLKCEPKSDTAYKQDILDYIKQLKELIELLENFKEESL